MSYRGRVIRRQPVAVFEKPRSLQEQKDQYQYLARVLGILQYNVQTWDTTDQAIQWLKDQGKMVLVKSVYPTWDGPEDALALECTRGNFYALNLFWSNVRNMIIPTNAKSGFLLRTEGGQIYSHVNSWTQTGQISTDSVAGLSMFVADKIMNSEFCVLATIHGSDYAVWNAHTNVLGCWYVHPFFTIFDTRAAVEVGSYVEQKL